MTHRLHITVGHDHPLEVVLALVEAATRRDDRLWELRFTASAFEVVKESAFEAVSELLARDTAGICAEGEHTLGLVLSVGHHRCNLRNGTSEPFAKCLSFLRKTRQPTAEVEEFDTIQQARHGRLTTVTNKAAILIGTGPSLRHIDLRAYERALTLGCNKLYLLPYKFYPSHHIFEDRVVAEDSFSVQPDFGSATLWMPHDLAHLAPRCVRYCLDRVVAPFPAFSTSAAIAYSGWTVLYVMLQIVYWMGVEEVYLVGVDGAHSEPAHDGAGIVRTSTGPDRDHFVPHYYGPGARYQRPEPERVAAAYNLANEVYAKDGRRIINCSDGSRIRAFSLGYLPLPEYFHGA